MKSREVIALNALLHRQGVLESGVEMIRYMPVEEGSTVLAFAATKNGKYGTSVLGKRLSRPLLPALREYLTNHIVVIVDEPLKQ